jgi:hypothetical protein
MLAAMAMLAMLTTRPRLTRTPRRIDVAHALPALKRGGDVRL